MTLCELSISDFNVTHVLTKIWGFIQVILCEFTVGMLWVRCVSAPLPVMSPRLQSGVTPALDNLGIWLIKMFSCKYIYYGFSSLLSCESPEIPILEVKNGV